MHLFRQNQNRTYPFLIYASCSIKLTGLELYIKSESMAVFSYVFEIIDNYNSYLWVHWIALASGRKNAYFLEALIDAFSFPHKRIDLCFNTAYAFGCMQNVKRILQEATSINQLEKITQFINTETRDFKQMWVHSAVLDRCRELAPHYSSPYENNSNKRARMH